MTLLDSSLLFFPVSGTLLAVFVAAWAAFPLKTYSPDSMIIKYGVVGSATALWLAIVISSTYLFIHETDAIIDDIADIDGVIAQLSGILNQGCGCFLDDAETRLESEIYWLCRYADETMTITRTLIFWSALSLLGLILILLWSSVLVANRQSLFRMSTITILAAVVLVSLCPATIEADLLEYFRSRLLESNNIVVKVALGETPCQILPSCDANCFYFDSLLLGDMSKNNRVNQVMVDYTKNAASQISTDCLVECITSPGFPQIQNLACDLQLYTSNFLDHSIDTFTTYTLFFAYGTLASTIFLIVCFEFAFPTRLGPVYSSLSTKM